MRAGAAGAAALAGILFQYSIGDALSGGHLDVLSCHVTTFNTPLEMPPISTSWRGGYRGLSILHWRCVIVYDVDLSGERCTFNTPLEMPVSLRAETAVYDRGRELSILHWRCSRQRRGVSRLTSPRCIFQYSIGDAPRSHLSVDSPTASLSILHWRCWGFLRLVFLGF